MTTQTTATQSGSSSGHRRSSGISDKWVIRILGLAFGIIAVGIQIWYWTNSKEEDHKFEIQKMKEQTQQMQLQLQAAQLGRALPQEAVTASSGSCQQLGSEGIQTISSGCFQFDNTDSGPRLLTVNTGGKFASIRSDRADKPYVIIKTEDGIGCTAGTGNECSRWISGSNRQLKVAIPQGQRLVINTNPL